MRGFDFFRRTPGILDWLRARREELTPAWEPINRNSLAQWWRKRAPRYLLRTGMASRHLRRSAAARARYLRRHGVKL
jgi:hypothetical protein